MEVDLGYLDYLREKITKLEEENILLHFEITERDDIISELKKK